MSEPSMTQGVGPAVTLEAFESDRLRIWGWFTSATRNAAIGVVVLVVLLALFVA